MQTSWFPLSRVVIYGKTHSFHVRLSGSKRSFEFLWFESPLLEKKGVDPCKFSCSRFPGSDLYDIDGKTVSFHVRRSGFKRSFEFCGFIPNFLRKKGRDLYKFCGSRFSGGDLCDIDAKTVSYADRRADTAKSNP